jgi:cytochrome P460
MKPGRAPRYSLLAAALAGCATPGARASAPAAAPAAVATPAAAPQGPVFDAAGNLAPPTDYRSWVFLTSGFAMSYGPAAVAAAAGGVDTFDSVFVAPAAYRGFLETGVWPESTMFVLEIRTAETSGSIVTRGRFQTELLGIEAAVKDQRFPGGWGYFGFDADDHGPTEAAEVLPESASCYGCHRASGAVEQTFTQFYPTLFEVARAKGTVRPDFVGVPPGARALADRIAADGWAAGKKLLDETAARWPDATVLRESTLNNVGYDLKARERGADAIAVFQEVTRRYPASANAWDSLSEACEAAGAVDCARPAVASGLAALAGDQTMPQARRVALEASLRARQTRLGR